MFTSKIVTPKHKEIVGLHNEGFNATIACHYSKGGKLEVLEAPKNPKMFVVDSICSAWQELFYRVRGTDTEGNLVISWVPVSSVKEIEE